MKGQGSRAPAVTLLGLDGFVVVAAVEVAGEVELLVETTERVTGCPRCGGLAEPHGRRPVLVWELPIAGRPAVLVWSKRLWRCNERLCGQRTWSERSEEIRARAVLTERARRWAMLRVARTVTRSRRRPAAGGRLVHRDARGPRLRAAADQ